MCLQALDGHGHRRGGLDVSARAAARRAHHPLQRRPPPSRGGRTRPLPHRHLDSQSRNIASQNISQQVAAGGRFSLAERGGE